MPIRMIVVIALVVFASLFTGFNLENKCSVWFFHSFKDLPVVGVILGSFVAGVLVMLPFTFGKGGRREKKSSIKKERPRNQPKEIISDDSLKSESKY